MSQTELDSSLINAKKTKHFKFKEDIHNFISSLRNKLACTHIQRVSNLFKNKVHYHGQSNLQYRESNFTSFRITENKIFRMIRRGKQPIYRMRSGVWASIFWDWKFDFQCNCVWCFLIMKTQSIHNDDFMWKVIHLNVLIRQVRNLLSW